MNLFKEVLIEILAKEEVDVNFPNFKFSADEAVEMSCYKALQKIKTVIENDSLSDFECIAEIVRIFEIMGSDGGNRHDFG